MIEAAIDEDDQNRTHSKCNLCGLFIGVDEQGQRFSQIGQGMGFVLADLIDYLIEHCHGLSIVLLGAQYTHRNESTKSPTGACVSRTRLVDMAIFLQGLRL
jgi:hypothetical protein